MDEPPARSVVEQRHGPEPLPRGLGPKPRRTVIIAHELGHVGQCLESVRCPHQLSPGPLPALVVCHGGTIRSALIARGARHFEEFQRIPVQNAELLALEVA